MRPLLLLFTATNERSYVEVTDSDVRFRFGFFDETVSRDEIADVGRREPAWYHGWGLRWTPGHVLLLGSRRGVVSFRLSRSRRMRLLPLLPRAWPARRISVAVQDPERLIASMTP